MCNYLWVVHKPHQASLLSVQYEVTTQELAAALVLLYVEEAADAVLSVHVRHLASETFPGLPRPGGEGRGTTPGRSTKAKVIHLLLASSSGSLRLPEDQTTALL